ncbi:MAG: ABC transporter substrate-binding protein, partial [Bacilli bacterium]
AVSTTVASDYNYLFEAIKGGADAEGEADGTSLDAKATDAKTVVVTLENACSYFKELLAFPTFAPVPATADATGDWAGSKKASTFVCNGPMKIKSFGTDAIVFEPNPNYYDTAMVKATEIKFAFSDDATAMLNSYKTGSYQMIDEIPQAEIATAATDYPGEYFNVGQLGTYYVCFNVNNVAFNKVADTEPKRESLRMGLSYLINRNYIVSSVTQGGQQPANGFVSKGLTGANGVGDWTDTNGANQDGKGWIDVTDTDAAFAANVEKGIAAIKAAGYSYDETTKKFTNVPSFEYLYNTSEAHKAIAEYLQSAFAKYGITMNLKNQDWATFVATRKSGDFTIARNGWLCDYNDPISMLDMWISTSGNDDVQLGKA